MLKEKKIVIFLAFGLEAEFSDISLLFFQLQYLRKFLYRSLPRQSLSNWECDNTMLLPEFS